MRGTTRKWWESSTEDRPVLERVQKIFHLVVHVTYQSRPVTEEKQADSSVVVLTSCWNIALHPRWRRIATKRDAHIPDSVDPNGLPAVRADAGYVSSCGSPVRGRADALGASIHGERSGITRRPPIVLVLVWFEKAR